MEISLNEAQMPVLLSSLHEIMRKQADDLWGAEEIAAYIKLSKKSVRNRFLHKPGFPAPVELPGGCQRWVAKEVRAWALRHR